MQAYEAHKTNGGVRDCGRFFLDFVGQFKAQDVQVEWRDQPHELEAPIQEVVESTWRTELDKTRHTRRKLYNGPLCRLLDCATDKGLKLILGPCDFKDFLGTNLTHAHLRYSHGPNTLADALGVSASVLSRDGFLTLGRRSEEVFYHAGRVHPIGGVVEPIGDLPSAPSPFHTMRAELQEELCIGPEQITDLTCLGLVRDKHIVQPELIFDAVVDEDVSEIRNGFAQAPDGGEHVELVHVRHHPSSVITYIESSAEQLTPVALASLLLHGLRHWGTGWFASARGYLRSMY
jgi:hypothetical protein